MEVTTLRDVLRDLPSAAIATFLVLLPIVNPFGGIPTFFALTSNFSLPERNRTAYKTAFYVFAILVVFLFFGRFVLSFFGISLPVLKIAGGLIVANTAWGDRRTAGPAAPERATFAGRGRSRRVRPGEGRSAHRRSLPPRPDARRRSPGLRVPAADGGADRQVRRHPQYRRA